MQKFRTDQIQVIEGVAPEALEALYAALWPSQNSEILFPHRVNFCNVFILSFAFISAYFKTAFYF